MIIKNQLIKVFIIFIYLIFFNIFGLALVFIPLKLIKFPFNIYKNILISSISWLTKNILYQKIFINSNKLFAKLIDKINNSKSKIIITSNHVSNLDFMVLSLIFSSMSFYRSNIALAKKTVGFMIPVFGFFGIETQDIFLHRNIEKDYYKLNKKLEFNTICVFPEGTCFTLDKKKISDKFCNKNNLIKFNYHLYPRTKGIELLLVNNPEIKYIFDFSIIYKYNNQNILSSNIITKFLFNFNSIPNNVYLNITKYSIYDRKLTSKIIEKIFIEKDDFIENINLEPSILNKYEIINHFNTIKEFGSFILISLLNSFGIYLFYKYSFFRYLFIFEIVCYFIYFFFNV